MKQALKNNMNLGSNKLREGMKPIVISMSPGYSGFSNYMIDAPFIIELLEDAEEEDFKTRIARHIKPIPKGTELRVDSILWNYYGTFLEVEYDNRIYSINPKICKYIRMPA